MSSSPSKAPTSKRQRVTTPVKVSELTKTSSIRERIDNQTIEVPEMMVAMFDILERLDKKTEVLGPLVEEFNGLNDEVQALKATVIKIETEMVSSSIIIRGLAYHKDVKDDERENFPQTEQLVASLFEAAKADVNIIDVQRFKKGKSNAKTGLVKVKLANKRQVFDLFGKVPNLKASDYARVSISREVPSSLLEKSFELEKLAYELRKAGSKTRIIQTGTDLILKEKAKGKMTWETVRPPKEAPKDPLDKIFTLEKAKKMLNKT